MVKLLSTLTLIVISIPALAQVDTTGKIELPLTVNTTSENPSIAPLQATWEIITLQEAKSAKVVPEGEGVLIKSVELSDVKVKAAAIYTDDNIQWATISRLNSTDIPFNIQPKFPGEFWIRGPPEGASYNVFIWPVITGQPPAILQITIPPYSDTPSPPDPPVDPIPDLSSLSEVVEVSVATLNDLVTQGEIKRELQELLSSPPEDLEAIVDAHKVAVVDGLISAAKQLDPPYKDWEGGYRLPVSKEIEELNPTSTNQYIKILETIVEAM